jgi:hypothetical protein
MIIPLRLLPYLLLLGGGAWLGVAIHVHWLGWALGAVAAFGWYLVRKHYSDQRRAEAAAAHQWLTSELAELEQRRQADGPRAS